MSDLKNFLEVLFDESEQTCFAKLKEGTSPFSAYEPPAWAVFFSINPLTERRADLNVTARRNFLVEIDSLPLAEQLMYVSSIELPYSTCTYSGGKSYHFIVALEESVTSDEYARLVRHLLGAVSKADASTKNPSRLSRLPGALRPDTNVEQKLIQVNERIPNKQFKDWLAQYPAPKEFKLTTRNGFRKVEPLFASTQRVLVFGIGPKGTRYTNVFKAAANLCGALWSIEDASRAINEVVDYKGKDSDVQPGDVDKIIQEAYEWKLRKDRQTA
jgi:hypothetical protein